MADYTFDHIAVGVWSIRDAIPFYEDELGGKPLGGTPGPTFASAQWQFANGAKLEALDPPTHLEGDELRSNFMYSFLSSGGPRVHHVTFKVPDIDEAVSAARTNGWKVVGVNKQLPSWKEAFIHPKQEGVGVVIQFAEAHPELVPDWLADIHNDPTWLQSQGSRYKAPSSDQEPVVSVIGLHMSVHARNLDAAMRLWRDTIKGKPKQISKDLVAFSWHQSPMQIFLHINDERDESTSEGVLYVELRQSRPWIQIPSTLILTQRSSSPIPAPHPVIGASFLLASPAHPSL